MNNTRVANATGMVQAVRKQLAVMADGPTAAGPEALMRAVQDLAKAEVTLRLEERAAHVVGWCLDDGMDLETAKSKAVQSVQAELLNGPDDTWSGRGNDLRRVEFEAKLEWLRRESL